MVPTLPTHMRKCFPGISLLSPAVGLICPSLLTWNTRGRLGFQILFSNGSPLLLCKPGIKIPKQWEGDLCPSQPYSMSPLLPPDTSRELVLTPLKSEHSQNALYIQLHMAYLCLDVLSHCRFTIYKIILLTFALMLPFIQYFSITVKYIIIKLTRNLDKSQTPFISVSASSKCNSLPNYSNSIFLLSLKSTPLPTFSQLLPYFRPFNFFFYLNDIICLFIGLSVSTKT